MRGLTSSGVRSHHQNARSESNPGLVKLAYSISKSCPNAVMRRHCFWLASSDSNVFVVDICNLGRRGNISSYADDAFEYEP